MVAHLVLYRPKAGLDADARRRFSDAIVAARREVPAIRRFLIGRRLADGPSYALGPFLDFPYLGVIEFDDRAGLLAYLQHPVHAGLGQMFGAAVEAALVYDFETADAEDVEGFLRNGLSSE
jgi:hypothetical protein